MSTLTSVSGFPRIGQNRELKKIIEGYWKGANDLAAVKATAAELRAKHWKLHPCARARISACQGNGQST